jgi:hypothetical protein
LEVNPRICVTGTFTLDPHSRSPPSMYLVIGLKRSIARVSVVPTMLSMEPEPARTPPPAFPFLRLTCQRAHPVRPMRAAQTDPRLQRLAPPSFDRLFLKARRLQATGTSTNLAIRSGNFKTFFRVFYSRLKQPPSAAGGALLWANPHPVQPNVEQGPFCRN